MHELDPPWKFRASQEATKFVGFASDTPGAAAHALVELVDVEQAVVGQLMADAVFKIPFDGVELRRIRRQVFQVKPRVGLQKSFQQPGLVRVKVVPQQHDRATQLAKQMFHEGQHAVLIDGAVEITAKLQAELACPGGDGQADDGADAMAVASAAVEGGRLAAQSPGLGDVRKQRMAAFVGENQGRLELADFFLIRGHSTSTHCRTTCSLRSIGRILGFCQLSPQARTSRER